MKVISFFSEKGGTGKTTLTVLMASYLAYHEHRKVYVMDCDFPSYQFSKMRATDESLLNADNPAFLKAVGNNVPYKIGQIAPKDRFTLPELESIANTLRSHSKDDGYFFLDFPGRFLASDPANYLAQKGLIDLIVFPVDSDRQSRASAFMVGHTLKKATNQNMCVLWNKETAKERYGKRDWYDVPTQRFIDMGIPVVHQRVRDILIARRDPNTFGFIRSTLCWPEQNIQRAAPYLENIFKEIQLRADGKWNDRMLRKVYDEE